ncbi:MAG: alpha/beta fold hydrolase [Acidobacteria bacterium]|nr:alpha/beta fold hydrolase [Acidobacteriota bacterium]
MATLRYARRRERGPLALLSRLLTELRDPTTRGGKAAAALLVLLVFAFLALAVVGGFFLWRAMTPAQVGESFDPTKLLGTAESVEFPSPSGKMHHAWFFPGSRGAPVILLCHGYRSSRAEVLTLATSLQQHRYNVLAFNLSGHGESPNRYTTLGYRESDEVLAALQMLSERADVDPNRIGLWGHSLGAYAALSAAPRVPGVKALALDSVYPKPSALLGRELRRLGTSIIPLLGTVTALQFHVFALFQSGQAAPGAALDQLAGVPKLFIIGQDSPDLAEMTRELYDQANPPKELAQLPSTQTGLMSEADRLAYENVVVNFFLRNLPVAARR